MSMIILPGPKEVKHPGRDISYDEMIGRGLCNPMDPGAPLPQKCSRCGGGSTARNPLMAIPIDNDPKRLAKAYLYQAICHDCRLQVMPRRRSA